MIIFQEYIFGEKILITKEFLEDICFITQHDHARVSLDIFLMINSEITQGIEQSEELKYAIRNHDCGWIEYDKIPKTNKSGQIYTFQNMKLGLQNELWLKSVSSSIIPYSALLIAEHFKFLSKNSISRENENDFIKICDSFTKKNYPKLLTDIENKNFSVELGFLKFTDLISLIICREREIVDDLIPSIKMLDNNDLNINIKKVDDSLYQFPSGFFREKQNLVEIPYKMIPAELIRTPRKLKDEYKNARLRYRRIGLFC